MQTFTNSFNFRKITIYVKMVIITGAYFTIG